MNNKKPNTRGRAVAIMANDRKLLLIRRIKNGQEYFVFPGGGIEEGETAEKAVAREIKEELSLDAKVDKFLFTKYNPGNKNMGFAARNDHFFLITKFKGELKLGGEELDRMDENDQYYPGWYKISDLSKMDTLYPTEARLEVIKRLLRHPVAILGEDLLTEKKNET